MSKENLKTLWAIQRLASVDLDGTSDEQLRNEFLEDGLDPAREAAEVAASIDDVVAAFMRSQTAAAKRDAERRPTMLPAFRPSLEKMKALIERACALEPSLAASYRKGSRQSDADLQTMYDDLVSLKKIDPSDVGD